MTGKRNASAPQEQAGALSAATAEAIRWRDEIERHRRLEVDARVAADSGQRGVGALLLDDPEAARQRINEAAHHERMAQAAREAVTEAERRFAEARSIALLAEADELEVPVCEAQRSVDEHERRTRELLEALVEHTRLFWRAEPLAVSPTRQEEPAGALYRPVHVSVLEGLQAELESRRRVVSALRAAAAGENVRVAVPGLAFEELPESLRPGGIGDAGFVSPDVLARRAAVVSEEVSRTAATLFAAYQRAATAYRTLVTALETRVARVGENPADLHEKVQAAQRAYLKARRRAMDTPGAADPGPAPDVEWMVAGR